MKVLSLAWLLCFSLFFFWQCKTSTGLKKIERVESCDYKIFTYLGRIPEKAKQFKELNNIDTFFMLGEVNIDPDKDFKVDETHLRNYIKKYIPNENASGFGAFDWETPLPVLSKDSIESTSFKSVEHEFIRAYQIAKEERPNIQWGYYALPFRCYWQRNDVWKTKNRKLENILAATDVIFPSVYDFYQNNTPLAGRKMDSLYVNDNIEEALKYGIEFDKPVVPFFWHRWHSKPEKGGMKWIPWEEFGAHIQAALNVVVDDRKIAGLIWWGADHYFHSVKSKPILQEVESYPDFETYNNKIVIETTTNILNLINEHCQEQQ